MPSKFPRPEPPETVGILTVLKFSHHAKSGDRLFECLCECGNTTFVTYSRLMSDHTQSCGCLRSRIKHGLVHSPEHEAWANMKSRCLNPKNPRYKDYAERGIKICQEWIDDFMAFYSHVGPRPSSEHSIDRFPDPYGNYEPGNVRWATRSQQQLNKRDYDRAAASRLAWVTRRSKQEAI